MAGTAMKEGYDEALYAVYRLRYEDTVDSFYRHGSWLLHWGTSRALPILGGIMKLERYIEWCEKHENLTMLAMGIAALILGSVFYCTAKNGGKLLDLIMIPITYSTPVMDWLCGC
jgi:hypothetical protein